MYKEPVIDLATKIIRHSLVGFSGKFRFDRPKTFKFPDIDKSGIYVHVPFCKQLCPFCPYNKIAYDENIADQYLSAVLKEIEYYGRQFQNFEITSVYFGGGTPTVLAKGLEKIIESLRVNFNITGPFCIETNPADLSLEKVRLLKATGIEALSLGVQSFNQKLLEIIGRNYSRETIFKALDWLGKSGISNVNIDLLFALPEQELKNIEEDLKTAISIFANQITTYPLFTFPYSTIGKYRKLKAVEMPPLKLRKQMYYFIHDYLLNQGFKRVSVWSFKKEDERHRYSSVTRERYIGFGPGAGSYFESSFTLNTFSVTEYINSIKQSGQAIALEMPFSRPLSIYYDLYWRIYDTMIPKTRNLNKCTYKLDELSIIKFFIFFSKKYGLIIENKDHYSMTRNGAFWIHLMQNYFSLRYINKIWTTAMQKAWPQSIKF